MNSCQCRKILCVVTVLTLVALPVAAYEILLDIDIDNDPATINDFTEETTVVVKVVLSPTTPGETITAGGFGLGGSCLEGYVEPWTNVQFYGTWFDLGIGQNWVYAVGFTGSAESMLLLGCPDDPGFHTILFFEPVGGSYVLDQPIFLGMFNAGVSDVTEGCPQPASNLAAMPAQGEFWNYIQIGGPAVDVESHSWGHIKATYR